MHKARTYEDAQGNVYRIRNDRLQRRRLPIKHWLVVIGIVFAFALVEGGSESWALPAFASPVLAARHHKRHKAHQTVVHASTDPTTLALTLAERYWASAPCGGHISVEATSAIPVDHDPQATPGAVASMWVTFSTPEGENDFAASPATYSACVIHQNVDMWDSWENDDFMFLEYCDDMTKEVGHFIGYPDEWEEPKSIMYPETGWENQESVPECMNVTTWWGNDSYTS